MKLEHIGIAVKDMEAAEKLYTCLLNTPVYKREAVASEGVHTSFFRTGESKIELLEATSEESPIAKFLSKRGEGLHHIAFEVEDIYQEMDRLKQEGFRLLNEAPKKGADNKLVCFVHPKDCSGVLLEICQSIRS
ncbi:MAG: methylmalonyl-CoA epimerase [Bacteroidota bacterium]